MEQHTERMKALERAIWEAIWKLEATKNSFRSRRIKEVRENLIETLKW